jgi:hypothetical protein
MNRVKRVTSVLIAERLTRNEIALPTAGAAQSSGSVSSRANATKTWP